LDLYIILFFPGFIFRAQDPFVMIVYRNGEGLFCPFLTDDILIKIGFNLRWLRKLCLVLERLLAKQKVVGSNPIARFFKILDV
jgi:hypothetical protein